MDLHQVLSYARCMMTIRLWRGLAYSTRASITYAAEGLQVKDGRPKRSEHNDDVHPTSKGAKSRLRHQLDQSESQAFIKALLGLRSSRDASEQQPEFIWGDTGMRELCDHRRDSRADAKLLIDWQVEQMVSEGYAGKLKRFSPPFMTNWSIFLSIAIPYPPQEPLHLLEYIQSTSAASSKKDWTIYYLLLDIAAKTGQDNRPEKYAKREGYSQSLMNTIKGYWLIDHDRIEVSRLRRCSSLTARHTEQMISYRTA